MKKLFVCAAALWSCAAAGQPAPQTDWAALLRQDAQALHDVYLRDHPGPVDEQNASFREWLERGFAQAMGRVPTAQSQGAYWWAMREYVAGFNDGHVFIEQTEVSPRLALSWPGFLTREVNGSHIVATRLDEAAAPALGSSLVSCDGIAAAQLSADLVGRFRGRWNLASQHEAHGWRLFLDGGNPYVRRPTRCLFRDGARERSFELKWAPLTQQELDRRAGALMPAATPRVELRPFGRSGFWLALGSFSSDSGSEPFRALDALVESLNRERARLAAADVIVLDVRGNGGGSSAWGDRIAAAIWGEQNARAAKPQSMAVDWRSSEPNAAAIEAFGSQAGGRARMWASHVASGIRRALRERRPLWRETPVLGGFLGRLIGGGSQTRSIDPQRFHTRARVYALTDSGCASACLDAMDVWTRLGAVPIGRETSADSLYMEIRREALPAGLSVVSVPMKVYRGRPRQANQPFRPVHGFAGDMTDQAALEAWIARLP
jgi:hypothetical protein